VKFENARSAIFSRLNTFMTATYPTVPALYENRFNVDLSTQRGPFVAAEITYVDGQQVSLELKPVVRYHAAVHLTVWVKEGTGSAEALGILAALADLFKTVTFSGVNARAPQPLPRRNTQGWAVYAVRVPFYFDDIPA